MVVEACIGNRRQRGLGSVGNSETSLFDHRNIIGAITDRERLRRRKAEPAASLDQRIVLHLGVDNSPFSRSGQFSITDGKDIGYEPLEPDCFGNRGDEGGKATGDQDCLCSIGPHGSDQRFGTLIRPDAFGEALSDHALVKAR